MLEILSTSSGESDTVQDDSTQNEDPVKENAENDVSKNHAHPLSPFRLNFNVTLDLMDLENGAVLNDQEKICIDDFQQEIDDLIPSLYPPTIGELEAIPSFNCNYSTEDSDDQC